VLELRQDLVRTEGDLKSAQARRDQAEADLDGARREREQSEAGYRGKLLGMLAEDGQKIGGLEQELRKADHREDQQRLMAPVSGTIQQLAVHTLGGVVTPAEALMVIVPDDAPLVVEAMIQNKDIGFVDIGQEAEVKLETFNFTRYGTLHGTVAGISRDASADEKQGLVYAARIALDDQSIEVDGHPAALMPGLAATVEIKTGRRRVIEYLLAPMLRYRSEGLRER
jgi:hemolysin D